MIEHLLSRNWPVFVGGSKSGTQCVNVGYSAAVNADALSASKHQQAQLSDVEAKIVSQLNQLCSEVPLLNIEPLIFKAKVVNILFVV